MPTIKHDPFKAQNKRVERERKYISRKGVREALISFFARNKPECGICRRVIKSRAEAKTIEIDHIVPKSGLGAPLLHEELPSTSVSGLKQWLSEEDGDPRVQEMVLATVQLACMSCNRSKGSDETRGAFNPNEHAPNPDMNPDEAAEQIMASLEKRDALRRRLLADEPEGTDLLDLLSDAVAFDALQSLVLCPIDELSPTEQIDRAHQLDRIISSSRQSKNIHLKNQLTQIRTQQEFQRVNALKPTHGNALIYMRQLEEMRKQGFIDGDHSPRASYENFIRWFGETDTVEDVLAGRAETANAPWALQEEILRGLFWPETIDKPDLNHVVVVTGNGIGKSYIIARAIICHMVLNHPAICIVVGPKLDQIRNIISASVRELHQSKGLPGQISVMRWNPDPDNERAYCIFTSTKSEGALGGHHGNILLVFEEASDIISEAYEAATGLMSGDRCKWLEVGNMIHRSGQFYEHYTACLDEPNNPFRHLIHCSAYDHPNLKYRDFIQARGGKPIIPDAVQYSWVEQFIKDFGEDSDSVRIRVFGLPPKTSSDTMIPFHLLEQAAEFEFEEDEFVVEHEVIAADIAGDGADLSIIIRWQYGPAGHRLAVAQTLSTGDHSVLADALVAAATRKDTLFSVDCIGEGSGLLDMVSDRGIGRERLLPYKANFKPEGYAEHEAEEEYANLEVQNWARLRTWLRQSKHVLVMAANDEELSAEQRRRRVAFPSAGEKGSSDLVRELSERQQDMQQNRIILERKKAYRKRLGHSPDYADAAAIAVRAVWRQRRDEGDLDA